MSSELLAAALLPLAQRQRSMTERVSIGFGELPAIHDMLEARRSGTGLLHEHWGDNVFLETFVDVNIEAALDAPIKVTREMHRAPVHGAY